ncbi:carboxymuconolactone decarboxylase family protein [Pseudomonas sp. FW305-E2]|uniref:carboxymuconolactone decarboxylase family protein n=1 Tax=Pseudomonas sp. FW305-E2 TaxID=2075558 RepID=UPI000B4F0A0E|nr:MULTISPECIES: carboxymuconolactone decarboxylase family protein [Pseudomonas]POA81635.1 carboxymuconolactone decarboxylase family protein [Pseudomonas sp. FW305-E2]
MARVSLLSPDDLPDADRQLIWRRGNLYRALANSPEFAATFATYGFWLNTRSSLSKRIQELVILKVASIHGSRFEWSAHVGISLSNKILSEIEVKAISEGAEQSVESISRIEQVLLAIVDKKLNSKIVDDADVQYVIRDRGQKFFVEFAGLVGMYTGLAHLIDLLAIDVAFDELDWDQRFPLSNYSDKCQQQLEGE